MKVLIVDDETHVREAIKLLGNWEQHGVTELLEATDGQAAIELIEEANPSIVMTDMRMPRKDGTALMEWISRYSPQTKIIVISGYDDFELVRHAIRHGGIDYILKPVDPSALNDALSKAIDTINQEEMKRLLATRKNIEVNRMKPHYADKLFTDLVSGHGIQEVIVAQLQDEFGVPESINECTVAVISTAQLDMGLIHKFKLSHQLLYFTLTNICNEFLSSCNKGVAFHHLENPEEIVLLFWKEAYPIPSFLEEIRGGIDLALHRRVHFGLGSQQSSPKGIAKSYQEAHAYLWGRNLLEPSIWLHTKENATNTLHRPLRLSSIEEQLRTSALSGSLEQIGAVIQKWMNQVHELEVVTPDNLKQWNDEWDWMMKQWMATGELLKTTMIRMRCWKCRNHFL
ncbi:response regulator [Paenibacillus pini]|uniref:Two-component response regulator YesN n=1 Tax=Paenibacillus pini JCM 16418 TaxID=1236976 RepID=W7YXU1_9BACL|nr:response regulator [Paenibacillus pini]GAF09491.1 two-component response regulator YesN [Paenibacillus pini JCM 16418]